LVWLRSRILRTVCDHNFWLNLKAFELFATGIEAAFVCNDNDLEDMAF